MPRPWDMASGPREVKCPYELCRKILRRAEGQKPMSYFGRVYIHLGLHYDIDRAAALATEAWLPRQLKETPAIEGYPA